MAKRGLPFIVSFKAWNTSTNLPQSGDAANIYVDVSKDGANGVSATNGVNEILYSNGDSTGRYSFSATASEMDANSVRFLPRSTTQYVNCEDVFVIMETQWGVRKVTITIKDGSLIPISSVFIKIKNSLGTADYNTLITDANGQAVFDLDDGTYQVYLQKALVNFTVPETLVVNNDTSATYTGSIISPVAASGDTQVLYGTFLNSDGTAASGVSVVATVAQSKPNQIVSASEITNQTFTTTTNASGYFSLTILRGLVVDVVAYLGKQLFFKKTLTVTSATTKDISTY